MKQTSNKNTQELKKLRMVFDQTPGAIFILDKSFRFEYVNASFEVLSGYAKEELLHKTVAELFYHEHQPESRNEVVQKLLNGEKWQGELLTYNKNGSSYWANTIAAPYMGDSGDIEGYVIIQHDISEKIRTQNALHESEEKYRTVIENATDGIVITQEGKLKFMNKTMCTMVMYEESEILERPFLEMVVKEDHPLMLEYHKRRMAGENFTSLYRSRFIRKDGSLIWVELNARTSQYNGKPAAFIIIRDISDRIKVEQELESAKTKLELLNNQLEQRVKESSEHLTEARTQLINLQKENLQSQFEVLKQQVNPHFLFNSLNVLTSLIKLDPDLAERFSEQLSKVYRYVLENKDFELVDLNTELSFLDAYIFLLNIRFVDKLKVTIDIPPQRRNDQIIPLAMQLLIENAIKHNIMTKTDPLQIDIFIDSEHYLNIVNNLQERPSQLVSTGVGLKNIQNRYLLLNNTQPVFRKTATHFIAKVPLVPLEK